MSGQKTGRMVSPACVVFCIHMKLPRTSYRSYPLVVPTADGWIVNFPGVVDSSAVPMISSGCGEAARFTAARKTPAAESIPLLTLARSGVRHSLILLTFPNRHIPIGRPELQILESVPHMLANTMHSLRTDRMAQSQPVPPTFTLPPYRPLCKPVTTSPYVARRGSR